MNDTQNSWSEELLEKYGSLPLPSLYDFIESQEKLAAEIRKQNKLLREQQGTLTTIEERLETLETKDDTREETSHEVLIQAADILMNLFQAVQTTSTDILNCVPKKRPLFPFLKPMWREHLEEIVKGYRDGVTMALEKMCDSLIDEGIEIVAPETGDLFDPEIHRVIANEQGGNVVARLIRYGYKYNGELIRPADITL